MPSSSFQLSRLHLKRLKKYKYVLCVCVFSKKKKNGKYWLVTLFPLSLCLSLSCVFPLCSSTSRQTCNKSKHICFFFFLLCYMLLDVCCVWVPGVVILGCTERLFIRLSWSVPAMYRRRVFQLENVYEVDGASCVKKKKTIDFFFFSFKN